jgi:hypothetical protein
MEKQDFGLDENMMVTDTDLFNSKREELRDTIKAVIEKERARLNESHPVWWADAVFGMRDIKDMAKMIGNGEPELGEILYSVGLKTLTNVLSRFYPDEEVAKMLVQIDKDGEEIQEIVLKHVANVKEH